MPRANRYWVAGAAYHLTHRCHDRAFLLRFAGDRQRYRMLLREELAERPVSLLSYCITSNHVHLLVTAETPDAIAGLMQAVQGRFAAEYNRRKGRHGAFWSDRYHATQIDGREHLWACLRYIDLNMVRAGVVRHPRFWRWTAWHELGGDRQRYLLVDRSALLERIGEVNWSEFRNHYRQMIEEAVVQAQFLQRDGRWTESVAVGSAEFVERVEAELVMSDRRQAYERERSEDGSWVLKEMGEVYCLEQKTGQKTASKRD